MEPTVPVPAISVPKVPLVELGGHRRTRVCGVLSVTYKFPFESSRTPAGFPSIGSDQPATVRPMVALTGQSCIR